jgi:hypothetical protein
MPIVTSLMKGGSANSVPPLGAAEVTFAYFAATGWRFGRPSPISWASSVSA